MIKSKKVGTDEIDFLVILIIKYYSILLFINAATGLIWATIGVFNYK